VCVAVSGAADFHYGGFEDRSMNLIRFGLGFNWY